MRCGKCNRELPANGQCFYCGSLDVSETKFRRPSTLGAWLSRIAKIVVVGAVLGGAVALITRDASRAWFKRTLRLGGSSDESEAVRVLRERVRGLEKLSEGRPGSLHFEEESQPDGTVVVTVLHQDQDVLTRAVFSVDPDLGQVRALDATAERLMNP